MSVIQSISKETLMEKGTLYIQNVEDGFSNYEYFILEGKELDYKQFMLKVFHLNGSSNSFVDFYYGKLNLEQKESFKLKLMSEQLEFLDTIEFNNGIYFPLSEELLGFLLNISLMELLFSTFYFIKYPCTIWSNYNMNFPIFFRDAETKSRYKELANECNLTVRGL